MLPRFKLKEDLIDVLKEKGFVSSDNKLLLRVPHRSGDGVEHLLEFVLDVSDVFELENALAVKAIRHKRSPPLKHNGKWLVADPSIPWFDEVDDEASITSTHGTKVPTRKQQKRIKRFQKATGIKDTSTSKRQLSRYLDEAIEYFTTS